MENAGYMSAKEAAAELNVSLATLYAYVSRGIIQSEAHAGTRQRRYLAADVRSLAAKNKVTTRAGETQLPLSFGQPLLDSEITFTDGHKLYFRGRDVALLAQNSESVESIAALIWDCDHASAFANPAPAIADHYWALLKSLPQERRLVGCQALLPLLGEQDVRCYDLSKNGAVRTGAAVLRLLVALISTTAPSTQPIHLQLAEALDLAHKAHLIRSALILAADHELNASTFTVRVSASAGAPIYHATAAGLGTLQGARHGGEIERSFRLFHEILHSPAPAAEIISGWLRRGEAVPGFGHPLYPNGDPRAQTLINLMRSDQKNTPQKQPHGESLFEAIQTAHSILGKHLNFDGALAALSIHFGLFAQHGLWLLAIGRLIGWVGHAIEQYQDQRLIRPRARYVGLR